MCMFICVLVMIHNEYALSGKPQSNIVSCLYLVEVYLTFGLQVDRNVCMS